MAGFLHLEVSHERLGERGEVLLVRVVGEVDVYTFPKLRDYLKAQALEAEEPPEYVGLDLSEVDWFDSTALGVCVGFLAKFRKARQAGGLVIVNPSERVLKVFRVTGLTKVFPIVESVEALFAFVASDSAGAAVVDAPDAKDSGA